MAAGQVHHEPRDLARVLCPQSLIRALDMLSREHLVPSRPQNQRSHTRRCRRHTKNNIPGVPSVCDPVQASSCLQSGTSARALSGCARGRTASCIQARAPAPGARLPSAYLSSTGAIEPTSVPRGCCSEHMSLLPAGPLVQAWLRLLRLRDAEGDGIVHIL